jgi:hypothetical protein
MFLCQMWVSDRWYRRVPVLGTCQCQTPTLMITLNIYYFLKLLSVLTCQCLCCVWCPCLCPYFIVELEHHMNEGTYKPNALRFEVKMLCPDYLCGWFLSNVMILGFFKLPFPSLGLSILICRLQHMCRHQLEEEFLIFMLMKRNKECFCVGRLLQ